MSNTNFKIINGAEEIITLSAHETIFGDDVIFWQLTKLLDVLEKGTGDERVLLSRVYGETDYFNLASALLDPEVVIDIANKTITNPTLCVYQNIDELNSDYGSEDLSYYSRDGKNFVKWADLDEQEIIHVYFDDESLLTKETLIFTEIRKVADFVNYLVSLGEIEFVLPSGVLLRLNLA